MLLLFYCCGGCFVCMCVCPSVMGEGMHMYYQRTEDNFIGLVFSYYLTRISGTELKSSGLLNVSLFLLSNFTGPWSLVSNTIFQLRKSGVFGKTVTSRIKATTKPDESEASETFNKLKKNRVCPGNTGARTEVLSVVKLQHSSSLPTVSYSFTTEMLMQASFSREPNCKTKRKTWQTPWEREREA